MLDVQVLVGERIFQAEETEMQIHGNERALAKWVDVGILAKREGIQEREKKKKYKRMGKRDN